MNNKVSSFPWPLMVLLLITVGLAFLSDYYDNNTEPRKSCIPKETRVNITYFPCTGEKLFDKLEELGISNVSCVNCTARGCYVTLSKEKKDDQEI
ncbi:MAG: hypothetical protein H6779_03365 [Candidatus Nomurabacteria bacterium]|nr:hypothetical protein [Candidatus Nomurabacteria bacterium]USN87427.1 MAG: hypothetical protein H6779_03365 [Candidatus Nomurabacteria bacterium]